VRTAFLLFHHVGLYASDPAASAEFYRHVFGMQIVGQTTADSIHGATAFVCSRPGEESHEIALAAHPDVRHVAFTVDSLQALKALHKRLLDRSVPIKFCFSHAVSLAVYFADPDGNLIEAYWPTGTLWQIPYAEPIDLTQSDDALLAHLAKFSQATGLTE
jgi:catechol-2,3-dioxygenase